jgi:hypothetical protein
LLPPLAVKSMFRKSGFIIFILFLVKIKRTLSSDPSRPAPLQLSRFIRAREMLPKLLEHPYTTPLPLKDHAVLASLRSPS